MTDDSEQKLREMLLRYITETGSDAVLSGNSSECLGLRSGRLEVVLVVVQGETAEEISELMGAIAQTTFQHHGTVDTMISSLVIITYGMFNFRTETPGTSLSLVKTLQQHYGTQIKILYGSGEGYYGNLGSDARMSYSFILPRFIDALGTLATMDFGEVRIFQFD